MPPRFCVTYASLAPAPRSEISISAFLIPFLNTQIRRASILAELSDTPGAYSRKIRRGRGPSSGKGKTSGRGHKGQKQHGKVPENFTGGQTPEEVVHGHYGHTNPHHIEMSPVNLDTIQAWVDQGRIDPSKPITLKELCSSRAIHGIKDGVKLLARGATALTTPIHLVVSRASHSAIAAVEALGGSVTTRFYTPQAIRKIKLGDMSPYVSLKWDQDALGVAPPLQIPEASDPLQRVRGIGYKYRLPDPTSRKDMEYYRDDRNRGYLSYLVKEGQAASLFFKPPLSEQEIEVIRQERGSDKKAKRAEDNRLW